MAKVGRPTGSPGRYVVRRHDGYALALDRERLDATAFVDLAARGRALLSAGDAAAADDLLRQALDLWRGRPYADWPDALEPVAAAAGEGRSPDPAAR